MKNQAESIQTLTRYVLARYPIISITSHEEDRVLDAICTVARTSGYRQICAWSITNGLRMYRRDNGDWRPVYFEKVKRDASKNHASDLTASGIEDFARSRRDPIAALDEIIAYNRPLEQTNHAATDLQLRQLAEERVLFVMLDLHRPLASKSPQLIRRLRDAASELISNGRQDALILLSPEMDIPRDLEKTAAVIDWPLPDETELGNLVDVCQQEVKNAKVNLVNGSRERVIRSLRGLTQFEAGSALAAAIVETGELSENAIPLIVREKAQIIRKSGVLEFYEPSERMTDIGGLDALRGYSAEVTEAMTDRARKAGLDQPKGVILAGVPGTGKSLYAKAFASGKMPLLRMDVGAIMGSLVGQSEGNMRAALKVAEAVSPCVLWIDEVDKALGGIGGEHDGGTSMRVFGTLLTWMQETTAPVYIIATANDVRVLKPEFIRRFDDIFWVDLPDRAARRAILRVHLEKRGHGTVMDCDQATIEAIDDYTRGYTGAELEKVVKQAIKTAFISSEPLTTAHLIDACDKIAPIMETMTEQVNSLRKWASEHGARQAGAPLEEVGFVPGQAAGRFSSY